MLTLTTILILPEYESRADDLSTWSCPLCVFLLHNPRRKKKKKSSCLVGEQLYVAPSGWISFANHFLSLLFL